MSIKRIITSAAIALLPIAAGAATLVVPAAGTGPGANGSHWQTELTLHSNSNSAITAQLTFHDNFGAEEKTSVTIAPRATIALKDLVKTSFHRDSATGAIEITVDDAAADRLAVTSRTFNLSDNGEFGQDIPAVKVDEAAAAGQSVVLNGPSNATENRFNAGLYAVSDASVRWELVRADGTTAKTISVDYLGGTQAQYNLIAESLFASTAADNDTLLLAVTKGSVIAYGSAINNQTGDPTYVPAIETRSDIRVQFVGVDSDLDNVVNIADSDHDGVLDAPVSIYTSSPWPSSFRIMVNGTNPVFELLTNTKDVSVSRDGYVIWKPSASSKTTGSIAVRVTVDGVSDVITIPVKFL